MDNFSTNINEVYGGCFGNLKPPSPMSNDDFARRCHVTCLSMLFWTKKQKWKIIINKKDPKSKINNFRIRRLWYVCGSQWGESRQQTSCCGQIRRSQQWETKRSKEKKIVYKEGRVPPSSSLQQTPITFSLYILIQFPSHLCFHSHQHSHSLSLSSPKPIQTHN